MKVVTLATTLLGITLGVLPVQAQATSFHCITTQHKGSAHFATVARRGERQTPPMIIWSSSLGDFTPQERCEDASKRLSEVVAKNGGKLSNLYLTYGRIDQKPVICFVPSRDHACNSKNLLFRLRPEDKNKEGQILSKLVSFSVEGSGSAVQQSAPQEYADLGKAIEKSLSDL